MKNDDKELQLAKELQKHYFYLKPINAEVLNFIKKCRFEGRKTYYFSNIQEKTFAPYKNLQIWEFFDGGLFAFESEYKKPNLNFYLEISKKYSLNQEEIIYIDDLKQNLEPAKELNWKTILYQRDKTDLEQEINTLEGVEFCQPKVLFLGKPNVGKSSLFNAMAKQNIQIVTDVAGTTLSVNEAEIIRKKEIKQNDHNFFENKKYTLLDSAGIRKPHQREMGVETFATYQTVQAAFKADVICLVVDGSQPLAKQDQIVAGIAKEAIKGIVIVVNKSDLIDEEQKAKFKKDFDRKFAFLKIREFVWVSAKNQLNLDQIWESVDSAINQRNLTIPKTKLRKLFNYIVKNKPPKKLRNRRKPIIYDLILEKNSPPIFTLLVKDEQTIHWSYLRFLENLIRKNFNFKNTEIKIKLKEISSKKVLSY